MEGVCILAFDVNAEKRQCKRARELKMELLEGRIAIRHPRNPPGDKDVVYVTKNIPKEYTRFIERFHTIYEPVDLAWKSKTLGVYLSEITRATKRHQAILVNSDHMGNLVRERLGPNVPVTTMYHEYDSRLLSNTSPHAQKAFYIGMLGKTSLTPHDMQRHDITHVAPGSGDLFTSKSIKGVHVDFVKNDNVMYHMHTSTKLATALALRSVFVCNRLPIYVELLGTEYGFFVNDDLDNMQSVLDRAKAVCVDARALDAYLESVQPVVQRLSPEYIRDAYMRVFDEERQRVSR